MKLQNHFTTIEQSKRLLELGVPANTADCYYNNNVSIEIINTKRNRDYNDLIDDFKKCSSYRYDFIKIFTPCWSVGRLMEMADLSASPHHIVDWTFDLSEKTYIEGVIAVVENLVKEYDVDFSKLEEKLCNKNN